MNLCVAPQHAFSGMNSIHSDARNRLRNKLMNDVLRILVWDMQTVSWWPPLVKDVGAFPVALAEVSIRSTQKLIIFII